MTDAPFAPFDTLLDRDEALKVLRAATDGADDGELFLERRRSEALVLTASCSMVSSNTQASPARQVSTHS